MKIKMITTLLLVGFLGLNVYAGFEQFGDPSGSINQYDISGTTWEQWMSWTLADVISETTDNRTFTLKPNISAYVNTPGTYDNGSGDGTKYFHGMTVFEHTLTADDYRVHVDLTVNSDTLDSRYDAKIFLTVIDPANNWQPDPTFTRVEVPLDGPGTYSIEGIPTGMVGEILQVGLSLNGINAAPSNSWGSMNLTLDNMYVTSIDITAPSPNPPTFVSAAPISDSSIEVVATTATDDYNGVEYYFLNYTTGDSSGWQGSSSWIDSGPSGGTATGSLTMANADFEDSGTGWDFDSNTGWGSPSGATTADDSGNGVAYAYVNGTEGGGYAVVIQSILLDGELLGEGDDVTLSADIKGLPNQNGGGAILKWEAYNGSTKLGELEVVQTGLTTNWAAYSESFTIPSGADKVTAVVGVSTAWGGPNASDSHYYFDNVEISGEYVLPAGLDPETQYEYYVKVRDDSVNTNTTSWSFAEYATTPATDNDPPTPAVMSFVSTDVSPSTIKLVAVTASDATSSVEYYFDCVAGDGDDSGWQSSPVYYDTELIPGSNYSYTVIARDTSFSQWSNAVSAVTNLTTLTVESGGFTNTLRGFTGTTDDLDVLMEVEKIGLTTGSSNPDSGVAFSASGATFGDGEATSGRNVLKTIASGYGDVSFEAYATLTFAGVSDLSGFIGMGQGLLTGVPDNWGVPELNMAGVNGVVAQFKDVTAGDTANINSTLFKFVGGNPGGDAGGTNLASAVVGGTETIRAKLTYDSVAETVQVLIDKNYTGGAFLADQDMGTVSTSLIDTNEVAYSMWDGAPVRVYVGGGENTIVKDFEIVVTSTPLPPQPTFDVQTASTMAGGGMIFTWDAVSGRTYDVEYKTNLVTDVEWMKDPSLGATNILSAGGAISATSTVDAVSVFYRILSR